MHLDEGLLATRSASVTLTVTSTDTAIAAGSGDLPVLATPRMLALMEEAACAALAGALSAGVTSVGIHADVRHLAPTAVGRTVTATATVASIDGLRITFDVRATETRATDSEAATGRERSESAVPVEIGRGTHVRAVVDRESFLSRLG
jgi:predicted thioesterase